MSLCVDVTLMSGKSAQITASRDCTTDDLRIQAQTALRVGPGNLVNASGEVLRRGATLGEAGVQTGDVLTVQVQQISLAATASSFAAILGDGSVVTWGGSRAGGDSSSVQPLLLTDT